MSDKKELFDKIYNETKESTFKYITAKCYDLCDIDDIFQNTYMTVYRALKRRDREIENTEAFVILIAKRELFKYYGLISRLKALARVDIAFESGEYRDEAAPDIEESAVNSAMLEDIGRQIKKYPLITQKILFLYYAKGYTLFETAQILGISESLVKKRLYCALEKLRRLYVKGE